MWVFQVDLVLSSMTHDIMVVITSLHILMGIGLVSLTCMLVARHEGNSCFHIVCLHSLAHLPSLGNILRRISSSMKILKVNLSLL